jgi:hypothetical protein
MNQYGVVLGRFQPIHLGHVEYIQAARDRCDHLVIGITNPDIEALTKCQSDPKRGISSSNPFTFFDRMRLLEMTSREYGWTSRNTSIVPADLESPRYLRQTFPPINLTTVFTTIYDRWGEEKTNFIKELGYTTEVLWRRSMDSRITSGTEIRKMGAAGDLEQWREKVPKSTIDYLSKLFDK